MVSEALAAESIARQVPAVCEHTPDQLDPVETRVWGDEIHMVMECECGQRLTDVFRYSCTIPEQ